MNESIVGTDQFSDLFLILVRETMPYNVTKLSQTPFQLLQCLYFLLFLYDFWAYDLLFYCTVRSSTLFCFIALVYFAF